MSSIAAGLLAIQLEQDKKDEEESPSAPVRRLTEGQRVHAWIRLVTYLRTAFAHACSGAVLQGITSMYQRKKDWALDQLRKIAGRSLQEEAVTHKSKHRDANVKGPLVAVNKVPAQFRDTYKTVEEWKAMASLCPHTERFLKPTGNKTALWFTCQLCGERWERTTGVVTPPLQQHPAVPKAKAPPQPKPKPKPPTPPTMPPLFGMKPADYLQVFDNQQFYNNPQAHIRPHSSGANYPQAAAGSVAPPLELTREQQAEVSRNYQQQLQQQQQLQMVQMQAMQQQYAQYAAFQQQQPGQQTPLTTSDGEDWLMAGTVPQEALPHKTTVGSMAPPTFSPTDPLEPYR